MKAIIRHQLKYIKEKLVNSTLLIKIVEISVLHANISHILIAGTVTY
jgi:hypothetical protein